MRGMKTENFNSQYLNDLSYANIAMFFSIDTAVDKTSFRQNKVGDGDLQMTLIFYDFYKPTR